MMKRVVSAVCLAAMLILAWNELCFAGPTLLATSQALEIPEIGTALIPDAAECKEAVFSGDADRPLYQWDITVNDKDHWHYARIISFREEKERENLELLEYMDLKEPFLSLISNLSKGAIEKAATNNGARLLKWYPAQKSGLAKHNAVLFSAQIIPSDKLPLPMFCNIHVYSQNKHLTALAFLTPDSDREYWQPIFRQIAASVK